MTTTSTVNIKGVSQILSTASNIVENIAEAHPDEQKQQMINQLNFHIKAAQNLSPNMTAHLNTASNLVSAIPLPPIAQNEMKVVQNILKTASSLASLVH